MKYLIIILIFINNVYCISRQINNIDTIILTNKIKIITDDKNIYSEISKKNDICNNPYRKINTKPKHYICKNNVQVNGYKIQILYSNDRSEIFEKKKEFNKKYPSIGSLIIYKSPDYKLLVGNYFSKKSANKDIQKIKKQYPESLIIKHKIICIKGK